MSDAKQPSSARASRFDPAVFLATGFWVGFAPFAPGTFGTLLGLPLAWAIGQIPSAWIQAGVIVAICGIGIPICTAAARRLGGKDPGSIVFDEIASLPITFFLIPLDVSRPTAFWATLIAGFLLHRLFDISKFPPARQIERLPEGLGIMADDWVAGVYSNLALRLIVWLNVGGIFAG